MPQLHYVVLEVDDQPVSIMLRGSDKTAARKMMCAWCEDIVDGLHAASFVAPLGGPGGRRGNTVGTWLCADFRCSRNVRRAPTAFESQTEDEHLLAFHRGAADPEAAGALRELRPHRHGRLTARDSCKTFSGLLTSESPTARPRGVPACPQCARPCPL